MAITARPAIAVVRFIFVIFLSLIWVIRLS
jgi:hypothetical protein